MDSPPYREHIRPAWWVVVLVALTVSMVAWAYGAAIDPPVGILIAVVLTGIAVAVVWITTPRVTVSAEGLRWGSVTIPRAALGAARTLDANEYRDIVALRVPGVRPFLAVRPWAGGSAVLVEIADADDPHTHIVLTTRHPEEFSQALTTITG